MRLAPRVMPAIVTPFTADGEIDPTAHATNIAGLWERGVHGAIIGGSNGEGPYLEPGERVALVAATREAVPESFVVAGLAAESLRAAVAGAGEAASAGADAILAMTPTTLVRDRHDLVEGYYADLADASALPVLLYSVPKVSGYELPEESALRLAAHGNVVGMKDSGGDPDRVARIAAAAGPGFLMFAGASAAVAGGVAGGAHGAITASANYAPELVAQVVAAAGTPAVAPLHDRLLGLARIVERHGVPGVKHAATLTGLMGGHSRRPLRPLSPEGAAEIAAALSAAGIASGSKL